MVMIRYQNGKNGAISAPIWLFLWQNRSMSRTDRAKASQLDDISKEILEQLQLDGLGLRSLLLGLLQLADVLDGLQQLFLRVIGEFGRAEPDDLAAPDLDELHGVGLGLLTNRRECVSVLFLDLVVDRGEAAGCLILATWSLPFAEHLRN